MEMANAKANSAQAHKAGIFVFIAFSLVVVPRSDAFNPPHATRNQSSSTRSITRPWVVPLRSAGRLELFWGQKTGAPERDIQAVVDRFLQSIKNRAFESYIALWSENSPSYAQQQMLKSRIESTQFAFANPQFSRFSLSGEKATVRVVITSSGIGAQATAVVRPFFYNFVFVNERGSWKIWSQSDAQSDLAAALMRSETRADIDPLLAQERDLVNIHLVEELQKQGTSVFFADPQQARKFYERANDVARAVNVRSPSAVTRNEIGITLHLVANTERAQGNYGKVFEYEEQALAFATTPKLKTDALINIGITHALQNDLGLAFKFLSNALESAKGIPGEADRNGRMGLIYDSLGNVQSLDEKFDQALHYYHRSLDYRKSEADRAQTVDNIGNTYLRKGDSARAVEQYNESLRLLEIVRRKDGRDLVLVRATVLNNLASASLNLGNVGKAVEYAQQTSTLANQINMPELQWRAYLIEAKARRSQGDVSKARGLLDDSINVIEGMRGRAGGGIAGRQRFLEDKLEPYDALIGLLMAEGDIAKAFEYSERSKANALLEVLSSGSVFLQRMMEQDERHQQQQCQSELSGLNSRILQAQMDTRRSSELVELLTRRKEVTDNYNKFLDQIYAKYLRVNAKNGKVLTIKLEEAADLLPNSETAIVEFSVTDDATYVYVLTKKETRQGADVMTYRVEITRDELTLRVQKFRGAIDRDSFGYQKPAVELFDLLLGKATRLAGKKTVILVPDGPLWELPFQALEPRAGEPWLEQHAIFQAPSVTALREMRRQRESIKLSSEPSLLALVNPRITKDVRRKIQTRLDTELTTLPNPTVQIETLRTFYGDPPASLILNGPNASEEKFRKNASQYQMIYVFSHGVLNNENPMRSYMVLASTPGGSDDKDGLLEAGELMTLRLKADLVILAGCETARGHIGRGEGMIGLAWALFIAGTPTVVVSQWRVPAVSTSQLMLEFHRVVRKPGNAKHPMTVAQALQYASLKVRGVTRQKHPLYWAGFVVVGDGL